MTYAMFDGLFQQALLRHLAGQEGAEVHLHASVRRLIDQVVPATSR